MEEVFHAYDIRGPISIINKAFAKRLGTALAHYFKKGKLVIGYDARINSEELATTLGKELLNCGFDIECIGLASTPYYYHCVNEAKARGGVMVTASHLPKDKNGFKISKEGAISVSAGSGLEEVKKLFKENKPFHKKKGTKTDKEYLDSYKQFFGNEKYSQKILVDCSNGSAGIEANILGENFNEIKIINADPDIENASHSPNPLDEDAQARAKNEAKNFLFCAIFDADGDRAIFIDDKGRTIDADVLGMLLARNHRIVVRDVSCTRFLDEGLKNKIHYAKIGRTFVAEEMIDKNADFGFERSGHIFYKKFYYLDNPALAILDVADLLNKEKKKLSEIIDKLPKFYSEQTKISAESSINDLAEKIKEFKKGEENWLDGFSYDMGDAFINLRKSNTEPIIRVTIGALKKKVFNKLKDLVL